MLPARSARRTVALVLGTTLLAAGCGTEGPTGTAGPTTGGTSSPASTDGQGAETVRVQVLTGPAGRGVAQAVADAAGAACESCEVQTRTARDAEQQARQVSEAAAAGATVVAVHPIEPAALAKPVGQVDAGETAVVSLGSPVPGARFHVGQDPQRSGFRLAQALVQAMDDRGGLLVAQADGAAPTGFDDGADSVLDTSSTLILSDQTGPDASPGRTREFVRDQVARKGLDRLDGVFASSAPQAAGAARALAQVGAVPEGVVLAAPGADVATWQRMLTGRQDLTLADPPERVGQALARLLTSIAQGDAPAAYDGGRPTVRVPARVVDRDGLAEAVTASGAPLARVCEQLAAECRQHGLR